MDKKKAVICTIFFAIVLSGVLVATYFIKTFDGYYRLFHIIAGAITMIWAYDCAEKFYRWLMK